VNIAFGIAQVEDQQIRELLQKQTKAYNAGVTGLTAEERQAIIQQATEVAQQSGMMNEQQPSEQDQVDQQ